jgi:hypothetical protein
MPANVAVMAILASNPNESAGQSAMFLSFCTVLREICIIAIFLHAILFYVNDLLIKT